MESWVFLNVGAVVIAKSHNLSEHQVVSYMLDWKCKHVHFQLETGSLMDFVSEY